MTLKTRLTHGSVLLATLIAGAISAVDLANVMHLEFDATLDRGRLSSGHHPRPADRTDGADRPRFHPARGSEILQRAPAGADGRNRAALLYDQEREVRHRAGHDVPDRATSGWYNRLHQRTGEGHDLRHPPSDCGVI